MKHKAYGFSVGEIVTLKVNVEDEYGESVKAGERLRIVAISPKVRILKPSFETRFIRDTRQYFFNAVRAKQVEDYGSRIRANFVTIKKEKS